MTNNTTHANDGSHPDDTPSPTTPRRAMLAGMAGIAAGALLTRGAKAGPLDPPPGPVTSTGKTLTEVEPRIAVNATNTPGNAASVFRITQPGSYYLTGNVLGEPGKNGIIIESDNVALDLSGFAVIGIAGAQSGIRTVGIRNNLAVRNGALTGWPSHGLTLTAGGAGLNSIVEGVIASGNGSIGLILSSNAIVRGCVAESNSGGGISLASNGVVSECNVRSNSNGITSGFGATVSNCSVRDNTINGISLGESCVVHGCSVRSNGFNGISVGTGSTVQECTTTNNGLNGISVASRCYVRANMCHSNGTSGSGAGIRNNNSISTLTEDNNCSSNVVGIEVTGSGNFIARNVCSANQTNWVVFPNNKCLVINGVNAQAINGNSGGTSPGSTNPNANYTY